MHKFSLNNEIMANMFHEATRHITVLDLDAPPPPHRVAL